MYEYVWMPATKANDESLFLRWCCEIYSNLIINAADRVSRNWNMQQLKQIKKKQQQQQQQPEKNGIA